MNMDKKSLKITTGAMVTAIFGVMLLLNRQTGNLLQDIFIFIYPVPMVAFAAMYGVKSGIPVLMAMSLLSFLFGDFTSVFYAVTQAVTGLIFGGCMYHKTDMTKTLLVVMILSAVVNLLNTVVLGFLFGIDINQEIAEMQQMMNTVFDQAGVVMPENILSDNYLKQMIVVSMILFGILQGFIVYQLSLQILRRLRFPVQKPGSIYMYAPPIWTGYLALACFFVYGIRMAQPFENEVLQNTVLTAGMLGYFYLICFGFIAVMLFFKTRFPKRKILRAAVCILGIFLFPLGEMTAGFVYIVGRHHFAEKF